MRKLDGGREREGAALEHSAGGSGGNSGDARPAPPVPAAPLLAFVTLPFFVFLTKVFCFNILDALLVQASAPPPGEGGPCRVKSR